ncbi:hypothetical protein PGT21_007719 [Puccinia graminis f. sp. tritici]|uniref:Uncharacterized protein n=1 Tax=Puccinia graminis f. sp. tritici TaxID=56615 RepID=A0A5B0SBK8_PUCGR|nr:hypothetical protein PGT21_007719 [Puccinia graminis f. sp. tritici]KAA1135511.1 hypothetical protein PGTUg99_009407 [Puccinia graminis f. sp. tritici]
MLFNKILIAFQLLHYHSLSARPLSLARHLVKREAAGRFNLHMVPFPSDAPIDIHRPRITITELDDSEEVGHQATARAPSNIQHPRITITEPDDSAQAAHQAGADSLALQVYNRHVPRVTVPGDIKDILEDFSAKMEIVLPQIKANHGDSVYQKVEEYYRRILENRSTSPTFHPFEEHPHDGASLSQNEIKANQLKNIMQRAYMKTVKDHEEVLVHS